MEHNPNNLKCDKNKCGSYVNCNNYECNGEHGQVSCTCTQKVSLPVVEWPHGKPQKHDKTQPTSDWAEEFDLRWTVEHLGFLDNSSIKSFIRQIEAQAEERGRREGCEHQNKGEIRRLAKEEARLATITLFEEEINKDIAKE